MTRLENILTILTNYGLSEGDRQIILHSDFPPVIFRQIAKEILEGAFEITSGENHVSIIPTMVELYYHEEEGMVKDNIVYHKVDDKHPERPLFHFGQLHSHSSGIDLTFEFKANYGICRASALIRAFRVLNGQNNEILEINTPDSRSTFFRKALIGQFSVFDGFQIKWVDRECLSSIADVHCSVRVGMKPEEKTGAALHEALRKWNFSLTMNDSKTDIVYLSSWLADPVEGHKKTYENLMSAFDTAGVNCQILGKNITNDYWVRDYMPIQLEEGDFLKYKYNPDYLQDDKDTITNPYKACKKLRIRYRETNVKLDGGNVVLCGDKVVMTDKVFAENGKEKNDGNLIKTLESAFGNREIIFIPWNVPTTCDPKSGEDVFGHSDGFIKYAGHNHILMTAFDEDHRSMETSIREVLIKHGFEVTSMDFSQVPVEQQHPELNWAYINFLQVGKNIFMPYFNGAAENDIAKNSIQEAFPDCRIFPVELTELVQEGGALHCISWNIKS